MRARLISNPVGCRRSSSASRTGVVTSTAGYARTRSSPSQVSKMQLTTSPGFSLSGAPDASGSIVKKLMACDSG
jgi:hypothetical protein